MALTVIVCGGRDYTDREAVHRKLAKLPPGSTVRHGGARGADALAHDAALQLGLHVDPMEADWYCYGRSAGPRHNAAMLTKEPRPSLVLAFPGGRGTVDMVRRARSAGVEVRQVADHPRFIIHTFEDRAACMVAHAGQYLQGYAASTIADAMVDGLAPGLWLVTAEVQGAETIDRAALVRTGARRLTDRELRLVSDGNPGHAVKHPCL